MIKRLLCCIIMLASFSGYSQHYSKAKIDSLITTITLMIDREPGNVLPQSFHCYEHSRKIKYKKGMANSLLLSGISLLKIEQYEAALKYASKSETISREQQYNDLLSKTYRLKADCYKLLGVDLQAYKMLKKALDFTDAIKDRNTMYHEKGYIFSDMADYYAKISKQDSAMIYYKYSEEVLKKINTCKQYADRALVACGMTAIYLEREQYTLAAIYLKKAKTLAENTNSNEVKMQIHLNQARLELTNKRHETAIHHYSKALLLAKQLKKKELLSVIYHKLSLLSDIIGDEEKAIHYFLECDKVNERIAKSKNCAMELFVKSALKNTERRLKKSSIRITIALYLVAVFILFLLTKAVWYYLKTKREKQKVDNKELRLKRKEVLLEKAKNIESITIDGVVHLASVNDPDFLVQFAIIHFEFYESLLELRPPLREEELKICAMRKLGFNIKEIAIITNVTVRSVEARMYRIRKKLNATTDESIRQWFDGL